MTGLISQHLTGHAAAIQLQNTKHVMAAAQFHALAKTATSNDGTQQPTTSVVADVYIGGGVDSFTVTSTTVTGNTAHVDATDVEWCEDVVYFADGTSADQPARGSWSYSIEMVLENGVWKASNIQSDMLG